MSMNGPRIAAFLSSCLAAAFWMAAAVRGEGLIENDYKGSQFEILLRDKGIATDTAALVRNLEQQEDDQVRAWSADVLGYRHETAGMSALRKAAEKDPSWLVRESAYLALARLGDASVLPALEELMRTDEHGHKAFLAGQLAELGDVSGYEYVRQAARSEASYERAYSARYFSQFMAARGDRRLSSDPFQELVALGEDKDPDVREHALLCLGEASFHGVDSAEVIAAMSALAERETDPKLREAAHRQIRSVELRRDEAARKGKQQQR